MMFGGFPGPGVRKTPAQVVLLRSLSQCLSLRNGLVRLVDGGEALKAQSGRFSENQARSVNISG